ncbi:transporter substrate-binding domain-containing protein [Paenibacillus rigui]|uniref:Amino acid ABC transporter substrate-binding protein n=1 Tax=Paenibacillus rigui TaxID=554312 RepID=A0A229UYA5_9BACL|nr:transporter substrate-binding domain-containing protein [Paenibacillus rigui]OXM88353.1 amino acid ABC transporter substrate-binding protein [Paenibacillus rigui]
MKMNFKSVILIALILALTLSACGKEARNSSQADSLARLHQKGEIVVATTGTYPPYSFQSSGGLTGFDIDISKEIGKRLGITVKFSVVEFAGMFSGLDAGRFDTIPQLAATEERKKKYDFTAPYQFSSLSLIVLENNNEIKRFEDLKGKKTQGEAETVQGALALKYGATLVPASSEAVELLRTNRVDALIYNNLYYLDLKKNRPDLKIKVVDQAKENDTASFAFPKGNEATVAAFNKALADMHADGAYAEISTKWFGEDISVK